MHAIDASHDGMHVVDNNLIYNLDGAFQDKCSGDVAYAENLKVESHHDFANHSKYAARTTPEGQC